MQDLPKNVNRLGSKDHGVSKSGSAFLQDGSVSRSNALDPDLEST